MSVLPTVITAVHTPLVNASARISAAASSADTHVLAGGLIPTLNSQADQVQTLIGTVAGLLVTVMLLMRSHKAGWSFGTIIGSVAAGAIVLFAVHGGLSWLADQTNTQLTGGNS